MESSSDTSSVENQAFFAMGPLPVDPLPLQKRKTNLILPTRESSRKRTVKTLGPDFVKDFRDPGAMKWSEEGPVKLRLLNSKPSVPVLNQLPRFDNSRKLRKLQQQKPKNAKFSGFDMLSGITPGIEVPPAVPLICIVCNRNQVHTSVGVLSIMLKCCGRNCAYTAHAKCLGYTAETTTIVRDRFKCMDCKRCTTCGKGKVSPVDPNVILCSRCDFLYHLRCNMPPVDPNSEELKGRVDCHAPNWICYKCKAHELIKPPVDDGPIIRVILSNIPPCVPVPSKTAGVPTKINGNPSGNAAAKSDAPLVRVSVAHEYVDMVRGAVPGPSTYGNLLKGRMNDNEEEWGFGPVKTQEMEPTVGSNELTNICQASTKLEDKAQDEEAALVASSRKRQDFAKWSVQKCAEHFMMADPRLASIIQQHNVSGSTLVLLSRDQIRDLFGLPLGVALKMHQVICQWREASF